MAQKGGRGGARSPRWPSIDEQLTHAKAAKGTALEGLIRNNQDFHTLRPEEASDTLGLPPWLRVHWRKAHPEGNYSGKDPTGGYPRVLRRMHSWMLSHPDLKPPK